MIEARARELEAALQRGRRGRLPLYPSAQGRPARPVGRPRLCGPRDTGLANLYAAEAVKYTTMRAVAERALDLIAAAFPAKSDRCRTAEVPLAGAELGVMS